MGFRLCGMLICGFYVPECVYIAVGVLCCGVLWGFAWVSLVFRAFVSVCLWCFLLLVYLASVAWGFN